MESLEHVIGRFTKCYLRDVLRAREYSHAFALELIRRGRTSEVKVLAALLPPDILNDFRNFLSEVRMHDYRWTPLLFTNAALTDEKLAVIQSGLREMDNRMRGEPQTDQT
jgi:hypothetical protein